MAQKKKIPSEAIAAGAGAVAGAAIGAAAVALSDKKNREKVAGVAKTLKKQAEKAATKMGKDAKTFSKKVERDITVMKKDSDKTVTGAKKSLPKDEGKTSRQAKSSTAS